MADDPDALKRARPNPPGGVERRRGLAAVLERVGVRAPKAQRIGRYEVLGKVGEGGMGIVFQARDPDLDRLVAIKVLRRTDERDLARFDREVELIRSLAHPRIVEYLDEGSTSDGERYLVMEWLAGSPASALLEEGPLQPVEALSIVRAAAEGLAHAHAAGVVHRDLKPSNIFLVEDEPARTKLIDFGVARLQGHTMTSTGALLGTPAYMAPEQIEGKTSEASDVYGLGVTLFKLLTGRLPFEADNSGAMLVEILRGRPPRTCSVREDLPASLGALVDSMMHRDPTARPATMRDLLLELADAANALAESPVRASPRVVEKKHEKGLDTTMHAVDPVSTPFVGRRRELGRMRGAIEAAAEDGTSAIVVVSGAPGLGKTRVLDTLVDELGLSPIRVRFEAERAAAPYDLIRAWTAGAGDCEDEGPFADLMVALERAVTLGDARHDPAVLADQIRVAWSRWLETDTHAALAPLVVDGIDRADRVSTRLLAAALAHRRESAWTVLLAVSDADAIAWLLEEHERAGAVVEVVELGPIAKRPLSRLARYLRPDLDDAAVAAAVEACGGQPSALREQLLGRRRVVADLAPEEQRVLAMASLVRPMPVDLLRDLLGFDDGHRGWSRTLERLVDMGEVQLDDSGPEPRVLLDGQRDPSLAFRCLSQSEQADAHARVADWLVARGHTGPSVIAEHLEAAGRNSDAARAWEAASRQALAAAEPDLVYAWAERGLRLAEDEPMRGALEFSRARGALGQGRLDLALEAADAAVRLASSDSASWFERIATCIRVSGQLGHHETMVGFVRRLLERPGGEGTRSARVVALARAATQLTAAGDHLLEEVDRALEGAAALGGLSPVARAAVSTRRGAFANSGTAEVLRHIIDAYEASLEAGDVRTATVQQIYLCSAHCFLGLFHDARRMGEQSIANARHLGDRMLLEWARFSVGKVEVEDAPLRAVESLAAVGASSNATPRIRAGAWLFAAMAHQRLDQPAAAIEAAGRATAVHDGREIEAASLGILIRAHLSRGDVDAAAALGEPLRGAASEGLMIEFGRLVRLAIAELAVATEDPRAAEAVAAARRIVTNAADSVPTGVQRSAASHGPHLCRAIMALRTG